MSHPSPEQLGPPSVRLQAFQLWVHGRQFPEAQDVARICSPVPNFSQVVLQAEAPHQSLFSVREISSEALPRYTLRRPHAAAI